MVKKFFIFFSLSAVALLTFYYVIQPSRETQKLALEHVLSGQPSKAASLISTTNFLHQGYLMQALGYYDRADAFFDLETKRTEEVKLARLLNAALKQDYHELANLLESTPSSLFEALLQYHHFDYQKALSGFRAYKSDKTQEGVWFDALVKAYFPPETLIYHEIHCLLEEKRVEEARDLLAALPENDTSFYLLGLSYLKESDDTASAKLALYYFEHTQLDNCVLLDKKRLSLPLQKLLYVPLLEKWRHKESLVALSEKTAREFMQGVALPSFDKSSLFCALLAEKVGQCFRKESEPQKLLSLYQGLCAAGFETPQMKEHLHLRFEETVQKALIEDTEELPCTRSLCKKSPCPQLLATFLLHQGKLYWLKENQERKGTAILKLAYELRENAEKKATLSDIERFFQTLYISAEGANLIHRLSRIFDALQEFGIHSKVLYPKAEIGNYLADAEYLFNARNYTSCKTHAELVLKLEPENCEALRLYGLSCYHTGDYTQAIAILQTIAAPDDYTSKALMLSKSKEAAQTEKELAHLDLEFAVESNAEISR